MLQLELPSKWKSGGKIVVTAQAIQTGRRKEKEWGNGSIGNDTCGNSKPTRIDKQGGGKEDEKMNDQYKYPFPFHIQSAMKLVQYTIIITPCCGARRRIEVSYPSQASHGI